MKQVIATAVALFVATMMAGMGVVSAQQPSLGDVARREEERRKTVKAPAKVYTNDSLRDAGQPVPPTPAASGAPPVTAAPPSPSGTPAPAQPGVTPAETPARADEATWKARVTGARDNLSRSQTFAEALQTRINALTNDFAARSDPAQRAVIATDRQKALAELERVKQEITQYEKTIADIQEEARRAGVPAGWVR